MISSTGIIADIAYEASGGGCHDYLEIWDGTSAYESQMLIEKLCGYSETKNITSISSGLILKFVSDDRGARQGFSVDFKTPEEPVQSKCT